MKKINWVILGFMLIMSSACATQLPTADGSAPTVQTTMPAQAAPATSTPGPASTAAETSPPPTLVIGARYPQITSSSDLFNQVVSVNPADSRHLAYCAPGEIRVSMDGGESWESVPTTPAAETAGAQGYALFFGSPGAEGTCLSVTLDPWNQESYYAVFSTAHEEFGAPPVYSMGFFTPDNGETWQLVGPPEEATLEDFGGFWNLGGESVQALFSPAGSWSQVPADVLITETTSGGSDWRPGSLTCPAAGPCLRWGPAPSNVPGMGSPLPQSIFHSQDGGQSWSAVAPPVELRAPAPNQLVALSKTEILIVAGGISLAALDEEIPVVRRSQDAGLSWQPVSLPPLSTEEGYTDYYPGLQYVSDHTFLAQSPEGSSWYWLPPELPIWCPVNSDLLPAYPVLLQNAVDRLWWVNQETQKAESLSIADLGCAVE